MTINNLFDFTNDNWSTLWPDSDKNTAFSSILLPYFSTTDSVLSNQYILNLVSEFNELFNNWIELMSNENLVIVNKEQFLLILRNQFRRWILKNVLAIKNNYESLLLTINDNFSTTRTYNVSKNDSSTSTYKEGFNGGGLSNQQGTKLSTSTSNQNQYKSEDTDKYSQSDTLRQLNYLQILQPLNFDTFFRELEEILFEVIWSE